MALEGAGWRNCLGNTIKRSKDLHCTDTELAAHCLWHLTFYGYTPEEQQAKADRENEELEREMRNDELCLCDDLYPDDLRRIAAICRQKGVLVISDEIHADLTLPAYQHTPFCSVSEDAAAIGLVFAGPTKSFNLAGVSMTAYCIIPNKELREPYLKHLRYIKLDEAPIPSLVGLPQEELMRFFSDKAGLLLSNGAMYGQGGEGFVRMNIGCPRKIVKEALKRVSFNMMR